MNHLLLACAGGAVGAGARFLVGAGFARLIGVTAGFPWPTLFVNIVGSFLMGAFIEVLALKYSASPELRVFVATGILGGFTTFSAFSLDFVTLMARNEKVLAAIYVISSVTLSLAAIYAGMAIARQVLA
ncbi:MAG: fluoride efflux transporter CrcB [Alphaproteobacteria bacterium]|nr:fluoride efflux transporter CrcB [Alphaproteobacteria bacterium]